MSSTKPIFKSFWMAGFEGADHINGRGVPLVMNEHSGHDAHLEADYARLAEFNLHTVRESIGWRQFSAGGAEAAARLRRKAEIADACGLQPIWTLMHYGWPTDLHPLHANFVSRFAAFCEEVARCVVLPGRDPPLFQPINEISFLSWAASATHLIHPLHPTSPDYGSRIKRQLVRATIAGCDALWRVAPRARVVHTDPMIHVVAAPDAGPDAVNDAKRVTDTQYEAWDMLGGLREPELGGGPRYLDVVGVNFYHSSQWEHGSGAWLPWHAGDARRLPLADMLSTVAQRYDRPIFVAETGHFGDGRVAWLDDVAAQVLDCRHKGIDVHGVCLYPVVDRPDWEDLDRWHRCGLWDTGPGGQRQLFTPMARRLRHWQGLSPGTGPPSGASLPASSPSITNYGPTMTNLIVFSHLRWDFVYQRPQHLLSRLAATLPVVFVEEPVPGAARAWLERLHPCENVEVLRPHLTGDAPGFHDSHLPALQRLLDDHLAASDIRNYWLWFYTPMALPLATGLRPQGVVYDCMDELSAFLHAPRQLVQRENALFKRADLVFTGGPSLYESKKSRHPSVHCFPSSVDAAHFAQAQGAQEPPEQARLPRPRLGYCGVIDERVDLNIVAAMAEAHPEWQIVMVGPVVKIDHASLPRRDNIHWLGQKSYDALPALIGGWDVCLMPFAMNASTRFISPTKTLEYMAAGKPVVSTPVPDVLASHGDLVSIAATPPDFIRECEQALALTPSERATLQTALATRIAGTSWVATAEAMGQLIANFGSSASKTERAPAAHRPATLEEVPYFETVVIGAGPTGLAAAYHLGKDALLLEAGATVGGWCRSVASDGFTFDHAGHIMFSDDAYVLDLYKSLLGDNMHWQNREAWIYSKGVYTRYPFQGALHGLPPDVLKECLMGAIEARFGSLSPGNERGTASDTLRTTTAPQNFHEFIYKVWGAGVARHFAIPYNRKLWAVPLEEMETSWLGGRVPMPNLEEMIEGALQPVTAPMGPNARFGYPLRGGFQALMDGFLPLLAGPLVLNARVVSVSPSRKAVYLADGRAFRFNTLISTMPLPQLVAAIGTEAPLPVQQAAARLRHVSVRCVNIGVAKPALTDKHWIYYPEDTVFHRIFVQGNMSPHNNAPGGCGLTCEISYSDTKPLPAEGQALIDLCIEDCIRVGIFDREDTVLTASEIDMPCAYVVYDHARAANVQCIREWLAPFGILLAGRYSEWQYYNSDHAFIAGRNAAEAAQEAASHRQSAQPAAA